MLQRREVTVKLPIMKNPDIINIDWAQLSKNQRVEYLKEKKYFDYGRKKHIS